MTRTFVGTVRSVLFAAGAILITGYVAAYLGLGPLSIALWLLPACVVWLSFRKGWIGQNTAAANK